MAEARKRIEGHFTGGGSHNIQPFVPDTPFNLLPLSTGMDTEDDRGFMPLYTKKTFGSNILEIAETVEESLEVKLPAGALFGV